MIGWFIKLNVQRFQTLIVILWIIIADVLQFIVFCLIPLNPCNSKDIPLIKLFLLFSEYSESEDLTESRGAAVGYNNKYSNNQRSQNSNSYQVSIYLSIYIHITRRPISTNAKINE